MSHAAKTFGEGYRDKPLATQKVAGIDHLVPGQHEAIWNDERTGIELSYVHAGGHKFIVVFLEPESLEVLAIATADVFGLSEPAPPPPGFELSDDMRAAVAKLKTSET